MGRASRSDERLLAALASGASVEDAASEAGLSQRTAYRRLADPVFRTRLSSARDEVMRDALNELTASAIRAVRTLDQLLSASNEHVQLRAARTVLEQLLRFKDAVELTERVQALEQQLLARRSRR